MQKQNPTPAAAAHRAPRTAISVPRPGREWQWVKSGPVPSAVQEMPEQMRGSLQTAGEW